MTPLAESLWSESSRRHGRLLLLRAFLTLALEPDCITRDDIPHLLGTALGKLLDRILILIEIPAELVRTGLYQLRGSPLDQNSLNSSHGIEGKRGSI